MYDDDEMREELAGADDEMPGHPKKDPLLDDDTEETDREISEPEDEGFSTEEEDM